MVYTSGEDKPVMNISNDVTMNSVDGKENIAIENTSSEVNVSTGVDENGNTVAGELAITAEAVTCEEGATIGMKVTVSIGGVEIIPDNLKIVSSDENVIKVNDDNTITGVTAGTTSLTATYENVSVQVAANVTEKRQRLQKSHLQTQKILQLQKNQQIQMNLLTKRKQQNQKRK